MHILKYWFNSIFTIIILLLVIINEQRAKKTEYTDNENVIVILYKK